MTARHRFAALLLLVTAAACGRTLEPPPIELTYRDSLLGAGKIVQISNTSNEPLTKIEIELRAPDGGERTWVEESLGGYAQLEVGWKKLGGWEVAPGTEVEVRAEGYLRSVTGRIPAEGS